MNDGTGFALAAAHEALQQAQWTPNTEEQRVRTVSYKCQESLSPVMPLYRKCPDFRRFFESIRDAITQNESELEKINTPLHLQCMPQLQSYISH